VLVEFGEHARLWTRRATGAISGVVLDTTGGSCGREYKSLTRHREIAGAQVSTKREGGFVAAAAPSGTTRGGEQVRFLRGQGSGIEVRVTETTKVTICQARRVSEK